METPASYENDDNLKATELRLGLPGTHDENNQNSTIVKSNKRAQPDIHNVEKSQQECAPPTKTQVVGWPPVRSYRKNVLQPKKTEVDMAGMYVKVSMDGAPYLRKIDLKVYKGYPDLLIGLQNMFKCTIGLSSEREGYNGAEYVPTYEDKDGDWMLAGDVPWDMFVSTCNRIRIMKGSEAKGLGCL